MKSFSIYIAYVPWGEDGKYRPVLVFEKDRRIVRTFGITTQYENKSPQIKAQYYEIKDWKGAGLAKRSYIDTVYPIEFESAIFEGKTQVGVLSDRDVLGFIQFIRGVKKQW